MTEEKRKVPQDRLPAKKKSTKAQEESLKKFMSTGIDFSPFTIDAGDGIEWAFTADPMPQDTERLRVAMEAINDANTAGEGVAEAFDEVISAIRDRIIDEKQKEDFPMPAYGQQAFMFFALHLATGRDGFPTESV